MWAGNYLCASVLCWAEAKGPSWGEGPLLPAHLFFKAFKDNLGENLLNLPCLGKQTNIYLEFLVPSRRVKGGESQNLHFGPGSVCGMWRSEKVPQPGVVFQASFGKSPKPTCLSHAIVFLFQCALGVTSGIHQLNGSGEGNCQAAIN